MGQVMHVDEMSWHRPGGPGWRRAFQGGVPGGAKHPGT